MTSPRKWENKLEKNEKINMRNKSQKIKYCYVINIDLKNKGVKKGRYYTMIYVN